jgi:hypothetical protein
MRDRECDPLLERAVVLLRRPAGLDPRSKDRLLAAIHAEPRPARGPRRALAWVSRPMALSPLVGTMVAAGLIGLGVLIGSGQSGRQSLPPRGARLVARAQQDTVQVVHFVLVAPKATRVALVGEFNGWDATATPMRPVRAGGVWSVALPLPPGRHVYAFVVDGSTWMPDPEAPLAPEDGFGKRNSVVVVGSRTAT